jgi:uncharacterized protein (TIGR03083 family)
VSERPAFDLPAIYRESRERLLALAPTLSAEQLATLTPTCPEWTVQDIYAHLTGLAAEVSDGQLEARGTPERTAVQVGSRRGMTIDEICDEWRVLGEEIDSVIASSGKLLTPLAIDVWTHEQDIANGAGVRSGRDGTGLFLTMNGAWSIKGKLRAAGLPPLGVVAGRADWVIGDDPEPVATVRMSEYELARAVLARRSVGQLLAYDWEGDPEPYLPHIPWFDPPEYDIVE